MPANPILGFKQQHIALMVAGLAIILFFLPSPRSINSEGLCKANFKDNDYAICVQQIQLCQNQSTVGLTSFESCVQGLPFNKGYTNESKALYSIVFLVGFYIATTIIEGQVNRPFRYDLAARKKDDPKFLNKIKSSIEKNFPFDLGGYIVGFDLRGDWTTATAHAIQYFKDKHGVLVEADHLVFTVDMVKEAATSVPMTFTKRQWFEGVKDLDSLAQKHASFAKPVLEKPEGKKDYSDGEVEFNRNNPVEG